MTRKPKRKSKLKRQPAYRGIGHQIDRLENLALGFEGIVLKLQTTNIRFRARIRWLENELRRVRGPSEAEERGRAAGRNWDGSDPWRDPVPTEWEALHGKQ